VKLLVLAGEPGVILAQRHEKRVEIFLNVVQAIVTELQSVALSLDLRAPGIERTHLVLQLRKLRLLARYLYPRFAVDGGIAFEGHQRQRNKGQPMLPPAGRC